MNRPSTIRLPMIDALRFIGAVLVPGLHVGLFEDWPQLAMELTRGSLRWIVPFFFIAIGFFIGRSGEPEKAALHSMRRLWSILLAISLLLTPLIVLNDGIKGYLYKLLSPETFIRGIWFHLWFLHSAIAALFVATCSPKLLKLRATSIPALALLAITTIIDSAYSAQSASFEIMIVARFVAGASIVWLGIQMASLSEKTLTNFWKPIIALSLVASLIHSGAISQLHGKPYELQLNIGSIGLAFGLFAYAFSANTTPITSKLANLGTRFALGIYLIHPVMIFFLSRVGVLRSDILWIGSVVLALTVLGIAERHFPRLKAFLDGRLQTH